MPKKKDTSQEEELVNELAKHENEWVAVVTTSGTERVVGSGKRIGDAKKDAEARGYKDPVFMKVPSSKRTFIATFF